MKENHISTHPELWYLTCSHDGRIQLHTVWKETDLHWRCYENRFVVLALRSLVEKGDYDKAIKLAGQLLGRTESHEEKASILAARAIAYKQTGRINEAIADFSEAIRFDPKEAFVYHNRGYSFIMKREWDHAIADFTEAIRLSPKDAIIYFNRGRTYLEKGQFDKAIADFSEAIRFNPSFAEAYSSRGWACDKKGDMDGEIADYADVMRLAPSWANQIRPELFDAYIKRAAADATKHDWDHVITDLNAAKRLGRGSQSDYAYQASAWPNPPANNSSPPQASTAPAAGSVASASSYSPSEYPAATTSEDRITPQLSDAYINRSGEYAKKGDWDRAIADMNEAVRLDPKCLSTRAALYQKKGDHAKAIVDLTEAIRLDRSNYVGYVRRGAAHEEHGDLDAAMADFTEAVRLSRYDAAPAYWHRAGIQLKKGNLDAALADANAAIQSDPNCVEAYQCRARIYEKQGDAAKAKQDLARAKELEARKTTEKRPR